MREEVRPRVLIVGSAPIAPADLQRLGRKADVLICADGGGDAALQAGLSPDLVLGDMDSLSPEGRARLQAAGIQLVEHPVEKDQTDIELALDHALALHPGSITITGALGGGRLDHTLGNVLLLSLPALREIDTRIVAGESEARAVWTEATIRGQPGDYVSLLPLTDRVEGIRTTGLRYPLHDEALIRGFTRGVSNELVGERATVQVAAGCLLVTLIRRAGLIGELAST